jgi:chemotaxis protein MotB
MVTFTDMISLLTTFFIMLMTFSTSSEENSVDTNEDDLTGHSAALTGDGGNHLTEAPEQDLMREVAASRGGLVPHTRPSSALLENLDAMGQRKTGEHVEVDLTTAVDGLVIHLGETAAFAPGSAAVEPALARALGELGRVLQHYAFTVVVEGHADAKHEPRGDGLDATALSCARALAAANVLIESSALAPELVQVAGLGATRPLNANDSATERAKNRRVEVRLLSLSKARAARLEALRR